MNMNLSLRDTQERMADLAAGLAASARRDISDQLNQAARRLRVFENRVFENEAQWSNAVVEATMDFCDRAALFTLNGQSLRLQAARGIQAPESVEDIKLATAPAFRSAAESKDTIVAMRTSGELSAPVAALVGEAAGQRFSLFPITARERVAAILYADATGRKVEASALELLAAIAGTVYETKPASKEHASAQRFALVKVAEMRLYKSQAVKDGRSNRDLYASLKTEIDSGREAFRRDFLLASPTMVDYFHLELLRTLANDDAELLGPEYPGALV